MTIGGDYNSLPPCEGSSGNHPTKSLCASICQFFTADPSDSLSISRFWYKLGYGIKVLSEDGKTSRYVSKKAFFNSIKIKIRSEKEDPNSRSVMNLEEHEIECFFYRVQQKLKTDTSKLNVEQLKEKITAEILCKKVRFNEAVEMEGNTSKFNLDSADRISKLECQTVLAEKRPVNQKEKGISYWVRSQNDPLSLKNQEPSTDTCKEGNSSKLDFYKVRSVLIDKIFDKLGEKYPIFWNDFILKIKHSELNELIRISDDIESIRSSLKEIYKDCSNPVQEFNQELKVSCFDLAFLNRTSLCKKVLKSLREKVRRQGISEGALEYLAKGFVDYKMNLAWFTSATASFSETVENDLSNDIQRFNQAVDSFTEENFAEVKELKEAYKSEALTVVKLPRSCLKGSRLKNQQSTRTEETIQPEGLES